jgi:hypothetical protein
MAGKLTRDLDGPALLRFLRQAAATRHQFPFAHSERQPTLPVSMVER